nr:uncharacterized protein LOC110360505 [Columba livia]
MSALSGDGATRSLPCWLCPWVEGLVPEASPCRRHCPWYRTQGRSLGLCSICSGSWSCLQRHRHRLRLFMLFSAMLHPGACLSILPQLQTDTSGKLCPPAALHPHSEPGGEEEEEESRLLSPLPELTLGWPSSQHLELKLQPSAGLCCPKRCAVEQHRLPDGAGEFEEGEGARGEDLASGRAGDVGGGQIVSALPHTAAAVCISSSCILGKGDGTTCRRKTPFQNAQPVSEDVTPSSTIVKPQPLSPITP